MIEGIWEQAETDIETFCQNMKTLRQYRGLSQKELAALTGLTDAAISCLERRANKRSPQMITAVALCRALGVNVGALTGERRETLYDWRDYFGGESGDD